MKALSMLGEDHSVSYNFMHMYANALLMSNPNSKAIVWSDTSLISATPKFNGVFISFLSQKLGFIEGCRPIIGLDGCHLKGPFGGVLLSAVSLDCNSGVFPIAMAVCEVENYGTWSWFLRLLGNYIGGVDAPGMPFCFMMDRQKGLRLALTECWPHAGRRFCAMHIYTNCRKKSNKLEFRKVFFRVSKAANRADFDSTMKEIETAFPFAHEYIKDIPPMYWSRHAYDTRIKNDQVTNNMSESFNAWIDETRSMPVLTMLEEIRRKIMNQIRERYEECQNWKEEFPPKVMKKLRNNGDHSRYLTIIWAGNLEFEVVDHGRAFLVDLQKHSCSCGKFQVSGIPCKHAIGCISDRRLNPTNFVDKILSKEKYVKTYSVVIKLVLDRSEWPEVECNEMEPPSKRRKVGRPKMGRRKAPEEGTSRTPYFTLKCGICRELGHNKRRCLERRNATFVSLTDQQTPDPISGGADVVNVGSSQPPTTD